MHNQRKRIWIGLKKKQIPCPWFSAEYATFAELTSEHSHIKKPDRRIPLFSPSLDVVNYGRLTNQRQLGYMKITSVWTQVEKQVFSMVERKEIQQDLWLWCVAACHEKEKQLMWKGRILRNQSWLTKS